jgi:membrane protease YdiL (CAAX protease family)
MQTSVLTTAPDAQRANTTTVLVTVFAATVGWTIYVLLIAAVPDIFGNEVVRAVARVLIVLIPALVYIRRVARESIPDFLWMRQNVRRGVLIGIVAGIFLTVYLIITALPIKSGQFPTAFSSWFNFIIGSPFAEEVLYRGVVLRHFATRFGTVRGTLISAGLFVVLHLPAWIVLNKLGPLALIGSSLQIFVYGVLFAVLYLRTKSFWAPFIVHVVNNLVLSIL